MMLLLMGLTPSTSKTGTLIEPTLPLGVITSTSIIIHGLRLMLKLILTHGHRSRRTSKAIIAILWIIKVVVVAAVAVSTSCPLLGIVEVLAMIHIGLLLFSESTLVRETLELPSVRVASATAHHLTSSSIIRAVVPIIHIASFLLLLQHGSVLIIVNITPAAAADIEAPPGVITVSLKTTALGVSWIHIIVIYIGKPVGESIISYVLLLIPELIPSPRT